MPGGKPGHGQDFRHGTPAPDQACAATSSAWLTQDGRALRADQAKAAIQGRLLEVGDGQGNVAIRTNDPCVEVLRHDCIFIQQFGRRNTVCGFHRGDRSNRTERYALLQSVTCIGRSAPVSFNSCAVPQQPDAPPPLRSSESPAFPPWCGAFTLWRVQRTNPFCSAALPRGTLSTPPAQAIPLRREPTNEEKSWSRPKPMLL